MKKRIIDINDFDFARQKTKAVKSKQMVTVITCRTCGEVHKGAPRSIMDLKKNWQDICIDFINGKCKTCRGGFHSGDLEILNPESNIKLKHFQFWKEYDNQITGYTNNFLDAICEYKELLSKYMEDQNNYVNGELLKHNLNLLWDASNQKYVVSLLSDEQNAKHQWEKIL